MGSAFVNERRFRRGRLVAVAAAAVAASTLSLISAPASAAPARIAAPAATPEGSVFVALSPCRVADTRAAGGIVAADETRAFQVAGSGTGFADQGGKPDGCAIPAAVTSVAASITAVTPQGTGFLRAWPTGGTPGGGTFLNFTKAQGTTNTGAIQLGTAPKDLTTKNFSSSASHFIIDVQGYFIAEADVPADTASSVFVPMSPCRVADTRNAGGTLAANETRAFQVAGSGTGFADQGGKPDGCAIPAAVTGVAASISAVTPQGTGFLRAWPTGGTPGGGTFLNFTKAQGTTNTGAIQLGTAPKDLTTKNFSSSASHFIIDVQGYFIAANDLPAETAGSVFVAVSPCRVADTRGGGGIVAADETRAFQISEAGTGFADQGGKADGCAIPDTAVAVEASMTAVTPQGTGFSRAWPTAGTPGGGTFLNFTKGQGTTNTGAIQLGTGVKDLTTRNFNPAASHFIIDIQGYFVELDVVVPPVGLKADISAGEGETCALNSDGTVECWGQNQYGQLGNGTNTGSKVPVPVTGITDAVAVAAGGFHGCAIIEGGSVECWGGGGDGQLGNGTFGNNSNVPVPVTGITTAESISTTGDHTCASLADGSVKCWGFGRDGQLGNGASVRSNIPVTVTGITDASTVSTGLFHSCAVVGTGGVQCWGYGADGQLGNGSDNDSNVPVTVTGITNAVSVDAGGYNSCAVVGAGGVECWGFNKQGQLGNDTISNGSNLPVTVTGITDATTVSVGSYHSCVSLESGTAECWGVNGKGQLGNNSNVNTKLPVPVSGLTDVVTVTAGYEHSCALQENGTATCWGLNNNGQLGNDTTTNSSVPVTVLGL